MGRFAQADTIIPAGVQGYDRYAYVNNNPVKYVDPDGHMGIPGLIIIGIGVVAFATWVGWSVERSREDPVRGPDYGSTIYPTNTPHAPGPPLVDTPTQLMETLSTSFTPSGPTITPGILSNRRPTSTPTILPTNTLTNADPYEVPKIMARDVEGIYNTYKLGCSVGVPCGNMFADGSKGRFRYDQWEFSETTKDFFESLDLDMEVKNPYHPIYPKTTGTPSVVPTPAQTPNVPY